MPLAFVIIGPGKLGTALGKQLSLSGYTPVGVAGRTLTTTRKAADIIGAAESTTDPWTVTTRADIVFITTPDGAIVPTCETITHHKGFKEGTVVLHCSGSLQSTILTVGNSDNIHRGSLHPLQSFAGGELATNPFKGINIAVEGDAIAEKTAHRIGETLGATCFTIKTEAKALYHASAVVASNYLVTLMDIAFSLLETAGIDRGKALDILAPLIEGTYANIKTVGIPDALTGPIARGDTETIVHHLTEMADQKKDLLEIYSRLGHHTIPIAKAKGTITDEQATSLEALLDIIPENNK